MNALFMAMVFVALRLGGAVTWDWLWVLTPLWLGFAWWVVRLLFKVIFS